MPLVHISRRAELGILGETDDLYIVDIANIAIKTIDSYLLSLQSGDNTLALEPISLSAVLSTAANNLSGLAKVYNCQVEVDLPYKCPPIMTDKSRLESAFTMLGYAFIESQNASQNKLNRVLLSAYKTMQGTVAGIFSTNVELSNNVLIKSLSQAGQSRQTIPQFSQSAGAGVLIADTLFSSISTKLRVGRHQNLNGLVATLMPSKQLQLV